jgi:hypothetical protein
MGSNNTMYDYMVYGHVPTKPIKVKVVTEQADQLRKNQRSKRNKNVK